MVGDAVMPLGVMLVMFVKDDTAPIAVRLLFLVPFFVTIFSSFVNHTFTRSILISVGILLLTGVWVFALVFLVVYPFPDTQGFVKALPTITSLPFLLTVIVAMTHSLRNVLSWRRKLV